MSGEREGPVEVDVVCGICLEDQPNLHPSRCGNHGYYRAKLVPGSLSEAIYRVGLATMRIDSEAARHDDTEYHAACVAEIAAIAAVRALTKGETDAG